MMALLKEPSVSVVVAAYNAETTIEPLIRSLLDLNYPDYEVIIVNDGSTDSTREIVRKYPVILVDQENQGASAARNNGLGKAKGEIIAYADSDTVVDKNWLSELVKHFKDSRIGAVTGRIVFLRDNYCASWVRSLDIEMRNERRGEYTRLANGPNCAFRKELLLKIGGFNPRWFHAEDTEVSYKICSMGYRIKYEPNAVVYHVPEKNWKDFIRKRYRDARAFTRVLLTHMKIAALKDDFVTLEMKIQPPLFALLILTSAILMLTPLIPSFAVFLNPWIFILLLGVMLNLPFSINVASKSGKVSFFFKSLALLLARSFAWGLGLIVGDVIYLLIFFREEF